MFRHPCRRRRSPPERAGVIGRREAQDRLQSALHRAYARLTGTQTFIGQKGTITTTFDGLAGPLNDPHQAGKGTFKIVDGAGEYAGIKGHGTFVVVVDVSTNQVIGTEDGQAN